MEQNNQQHIINGIDYKKVFSLLWQYRKKFYYAWGITFLLSSAIIICIPRTYESSTKLATEYDLQGVSSLSDLASSFGFDISTGPTTDAISPSLYPDLLESYEFLYRLSQMEIKDKKGNKYLVYDYYEQWKRPWWWYCYRYSIYQLVTLLSGDDVEASLGEEGEINPLRLNKQQNEVIKNIREHISCKTDKKSNVVTITTGAQDPLISAQMAEKTSLLLQEYITEYRTKKASIDVAYYDLLRQEKKQLANKVRESYAHFADSHKSSTKQIFKGQQDAIKNELDILQSAYKNAEVQYQASLAKLQEKTPAFTVLQGAAMPLKASYPKRVFFVLGMLALVSFGLGVWCLRDILLNETH